MTPRFLTGSAADDDIEGTAATDRIAGGAGDDTLRGEEGDDWLEGGTGRDSLSGGPGDDYLDWSTLTPDETGPDTLDGGPGIDAGSYFAPADVSGLHFTLQDNLSAPLALPGGTVISSIESIRLQGSAYADFIEGGDRDDWLAGVDGADTLLGGEGDDWLNPGMAEYAGDQHGDSVLGGADNDSIFTYVGFGGAPDTLDGGAGADTCWLIVATDYRMPALRAADLGAALFVLPDGTLVSNFERLVYSGSGFDDTVRGAAAADGLHGNAGNDWLAGGASRDVITGGEGNDTLKGGTGIDRMEGGPGDDLYIVQNRDVLIESTNAGYDTVRALESWTLGKNIERIILSGTSPAGATGNTLANTLLGNPAPNALAGLAGDDALYGRRGDDTLAGGNGQDTLQGDAGNDVFVLDSGAGGAQGSDTINDFFPGTDRLQISASAFAGIEAGITTVPAEQFYAAPGAARAVTAEHRLIYDTESGTLYYDPDAAGGDPARQIALLGTGQHPALSAADFLVLP